MTTITNTERTPIIGAVNVEVINNQADTAVQNVAKSCFEGIKDFFSAHKQKMALAAVYIATTAALFTVMGPAALGIGALATAVLLGMAGFPR